MIQQWAWGHTPAGFKRVLMDRTQMIVVREGLETFLVPEKFLSQTGSGKESSAFYGRGRLGLVRLDNGETALVRAYRHGGVLRRFLGYLFFTWPPRPFKELALTEEARRRGIPTLEILAAWVKRAGGPFYRGWLVSRELGGADNLWSALQSQLYAGRGVTSLLRSVAQSLCAMHRRGIYHGDLNLRNVLVRQEANEIRSYVIDFDKAQLFSQEIPPRKAQRNLDRLLRSVRKLDPERRFLSVDDWDLFMRFYQEARCG